MSFQPCDGEIDERLGREQLRIACAHLPGARLSCFQEIEQDPWKIVAVLPDGDAIVVIEALDPLLADIRTLVVSPYAALARYAGEVFGPMRHRHGIGVRAKSQHETSAVREARDDRARRCLHQPPSSERRTVLHHPHPGAS